MATDADNVTVPEPAYVRTSYTIPPETFVVAFGAPVVVSVTEDGVFCNGGINRDHFGSPPEMFAVRAVVTLTARSPRMR